MLVRRLIRSRIQAQTTLTARSYQGTDKHIQPKKPYGTLPDEQEKNFIPFESPLVSTQNRYEDEPAPTNDDMIVTHYLKHHPLYEFRNLEEFHVDNYRHWLHARVGMPCAPPHRHRNRRRADPQPLRPETTHHPTTVLCSWSLSMP